MLVLLHGSATTSAFDEVSSDIDVDFLVEFDDPYSPSYSPGACRSLEGTSP